jgi:hypothetical protein
MTKVGSTFVLDETLDLIPGGATSSISAIGPTVTLVPFSVPVVTNGTGTLDQAPHAVGDAVNGDFDISFNGAVGNGSFFCYGVKYAIDSYVIIYTLTNSTARLASWLNGARSLGPQLTVGSGQRYFRLVRAGNDFTAYYKTTEGAAWILIGSITAVQTSAGNSLITSDYQGSQPSESGTFLNYTEPAGIVTIPANFGAGKAADFSTSAESLSGAITATYQTTDDPTVSNFVPPIPETLAALITRTNTDLPLMGIRVYVDGDAGGGWNSYAVDDQTPDVTPPGVPTISNLESVGTDPNLGFFSDWVEPVDVDFDHVKGQLNINSGGWLDIDNTASLGGATPMKFGEYLAGTQTQAAGWLYQNHYARNGYTEGTTAQTRFRSVDTAGNESAYSTSGIITLESSAGEPGSATITGVSVGDGSITISYTAASETDVIYARWRKNKPSLDWADRSESFKRTGSGDITVTGLVNGIQYEVSGQPFAGSCYGDFSNSYFAVPDSDAFAVSRANSKLTVRDRTAITALQVAQRRGVRIDFQNVQETGDIVSLYAIVDTPSTLTVGVRTGQIDRSDIVLVVPRQTNFPPASIEPNCIVTLNEKVYQVDTVDFDNEDINMTSVFTLTCSVSGDCYGY